jgi:DNA-binding transcriptional ArsR family regulator
MTSTKTLISPSGLGSSPAAMAQLRSSAGRACALLKAMANEDRLLLLCQLAEGERNVSELQANTDIVQPTLSQQLSVLREEGLVDTRRDGKYIYYRLASSDVMAVMQALYSSFCGSVPRLPKPHAKEPAR